MWCHFNGRISVKMLGETLINVTETAIIYILLGTLIIVHYSQLYAIS